MTYCVGILLQDGVVMASDSRTNAGVDDVATFCKMTVFERPGDRVLVLLSSGNLAGTQAVINVLKQRGDVADGPPTLWTARTMFDVAVLVSDAVRDVERRDAPFLDGGPVAFNASFIIGGPICGEPPRLFRVYAEGNFIEAGSDTPFLQTGEAKYGKPIIDRVISPGTSLADATKCILMRRRFDQGDAYFSALSAEWRAGVRTVFRQLPDLAWDGSHDGSAPPGHIVR